MELIFLLELTDLLSGNKEKVKCSSGKVAYRACDKVLLFKVFLYKIRIGEMGGGAEILDFRVSYVFYFRHQLLLGLLKTKAACKNQLCNN